MLQAIHQQKLEEFTQYLRILGYESADLLPRGVRELFQQMEAQGKTFEQIRTEDLQAHYEYLLTRPHQRTGGALSLHTIKRHFFGIRLFFDFLHKTNQLQINPMSALHLVIRPKNSRHSLEEKAIDRLYKVCKTLQERAIMALFYGCGLRKSEGANLQLRDVDLRSAWLYVRQGKGKQRRVIPLAENVLTDLKNYRYQMRPTQYSRFTKMMDKKAFMLNANGTKMSGDSYYTYFKRLVERAKLPSNISLHHLRHSIATHLLNAGMPVERVRDFLGHKHLESTQIYTHI